MLAIQAPDAVERAVLEGLPWTAYLPVPDRALFIRDLTQTLAASADLENFSLLVRLLREWRATAEIHADPELAARMKRPIKLTGKEQRVPKP
jgi:hypothetical protein